jgi:hypothetical protein
VIGPFLDKIEKAEAEEMDALIIGVFFFLGSFCKLLASKF